MALALGCVLNLTGAISVLAQTPNSVVTVVVTGAAAASENKTAAPKATIACALFRTADGFPGESEKAFARQRVPVADPAVCTFSNVPPGPIAVAVAVDSNGNGKADTNLFGIPKEAWGVSNNVRPGMRAPRFAEAQQTVDKPQVQVPVTVKR